MTDEITTVRLKGLLDSGSADEAIALAKARDTKPIRDADLHVAWADLLEELGLPDEVVLELNLAIRDDPERLNVYPRLAEVLLDQGQPLRASRVWAALTKRNPKEPLYHERFAEALKEAKEFEKAREAYQTALDETGDQRFARLLKEMSFLDAGEPSAQEISEPATLVPRQHDLVTFVTLFSGREGVYARQWVSPTGESGYTPVEEPLTLKVAENHLLGNFTIGSYPVRLDNTVNYIAFDLDVAKFAVAKAITSRTAWNGLMTKIHRVACNLVDVAAGHELSMYIEDSGFKGRHCWIFLDSPVQAGVAKKCAEVLASRVMPLPAEVTIELFPKQTSVKRGGLGNLIKLPLGIHRRTGKRALFLEPDGSPYPDQLEVLHRVRKASRRAVYGAIQKLNVPRLVAVAGGGAAAEVEEFEPPEATAMEELAPQPEYDLDRDPQFQYLMLKCPTLKAIIEKVNRTASLSKDESLVLIHTLGHLDHGPDAVNEIFTRCLNADPTLFLKSRLKGHPMSCPKIRSRIGDITSTVPCNCIFETGVNLYPTPLIHVRGMTGTSAPAVLGITVDSLQFQNLLQDYLKLRRQLRETQILLERYDARLSQFFEEAGVESVSTPTGTLRIVRDESGRNSFTLDI